MKKTIVAISVSIAFALVAYELAFRYHTSNFAGVEFRDNEACIYYDYDLVSGERWRYQLFYPRLYAPVGSLRIKNSGDIYLVGGKLYKKESDGSLRDWSEVMRRSADKKT